MAVITWIIEHPVLVLLCSLVGVMIIVIIIRVIRALLLFGIVNIIVHWWFRNWR